MKRIKKQREKQFLRARHMALRGEINRQIKKLLIEKYPQFAKAIYFTRWYFF